MAYSREARAEARVEKLEESASDSTILRISTSWHVYDRNPDDENGPPVLCDVEPDLDLVLDTSTGVRILRGEDLDAEAYDELAQAVDRHVEIAITVSPVQREILADDESKVVAMLSSNRAGKTEVCKWAIVRAWMRGRGRFCWLAPSRKMTQIGVDKLVRGDDETPPAFPPELVRSYPPSHLVPDQAIHLIDGSQVDLHHGRGSGDAVRGVKFRCAVVDETTAIHSSSVYDMVLTRLTYRGSQMWTASTPKKGHWARTHILARAGVPGSGVRTYRLSMFENPWLSPEEAEKIVQAMGGHQAPKVRIECYGEWIGDGREAFAAWEPERHLVLDDDLRTVEALVEAGRLPSHFRDITAQVASARFRTRDPDIVAIAGIDFNLNPMSVVLARIFGDPRDPSTWGVYVFDLLQLVGDVHVLCDELEEKWPGVPIAMDATAAMVGAAMQAAQGSRGSMTHQIQLQSRGFVSEPCWAVKGRPRAPLQADSLSLTNWLFRRGRILVAGRCLRLLEALDRLTLTAEGKQYKPPGSELDRLSGPSDALRYLTWFLFWREFFDLGKRNAGQNKEAPGGSRRRLDGGKW